MEPLVSRNEFSTLAPDDQPFQELADTLDDHSKQELENKLDNELFHLPQNLVIAAGQTKQRRKRRYGPNQEVHSTAQYFDQPHRSDLRPRTSDL